MKLALLLVAACSIFHETFSRSIVLNAAAAWRRYVTSDVSEVSEFLADNSIQLFWNFVDEFCKHSNKVDDLVLSSVSDLSESSLELQTLALETASSILPTTMHALMETSINLGVYSPSVQFFESFTKQMNVKKPCGKGNSFIIVSPYTNVFCSTREAVSYFSNYSASTILDDVEGTGPNSWDHMYPSKSTSTLNFILYGALGTSSFCSEHKSLVEQALSGTIKYSARHAAEAIGLEQTDAQTSLQGYGVFLDIKNMEYKVYSCFRKYYLALPLTLTHIYCLALPLTLTHILTL